MQVYKSKLRNRGRSISLGHVKNSFSIITYKAYKYYSEKTKRKNKEEIQNYVEHGKIISEIYKILGEKITESQGGVFMDGLGYFGIVQETHKKPAKTILRSQIKLNPKTGNKIYSIGYVPIEKTNTFKAWVFDYSFVRLIRHNLSVQLKNSKKYSFNPSLFFYKLKKTNNNF